MRHGTAGILATVLTAVLFAGCRQAQPQTPSQATPAPNEKQARLLAAENADLRQQAVAKQTEIEALRSRHAKDLAQRDQELAKCKARIEALEKELNTGLAERADNLAKTLMQENAKLRQEIERLKAEIADPKAQ